MKSISLLCGAILFSLVGQAHHGQRYLTKDTVQHVLLDTLEISAPPGPPPYQPSAPKVWEIKNTRVALSFNWAEKTAAAKEWIKMRPYCYNQDTIGLDAKGMKVNKISLLMGDKPTSLQFTHSNDRLKIQLPHSYTPSDSILLYLEYIAMPYAEQTGGSAAITDDRGLYFINTDYKVPIKPAQIWTQGETESNSHWMITDDKPNTRFTTQIELTVPDSFTTLSNGAMIKSTKSTGGIRTDIWRMDMPIQAYAVMFAIGRYNVIKNKWRGKEVNYYVEPAFASTAKLMFNYTPEMMEFFSKKTGVPYPWNKYSQVVVRDYVSGAMENTTATLFGEFINQNAREIADKNSEDVVSHELFHQWFGDYVTAESWSNITVNESFANYGEQLWRAHQYGRSNADELAWDDLQKYIRMADYKDPQLVRFNYDNREEVFDAISYNKGGAILHYLNTLIGDAAFDKAMKIYLTKNALHSAEAHDWRMAVEEATGQDWNWFFNQWYYHAGHPELKIAYKYSDRLGRVKVSVTQAQDDSNYRYTLPLKTKIIYGDEQFVVDWNIKKKTDTFIYYYKNGQRPTVIPDCLHVLPGKIKENKKPAEWLAQYSASKEYISRYIAVNSVTNDLDDSDALHLVDGALSDSLPGIRVLALVTLGGKKNEKYVSRWTPTVVKMATSDVAAKVRAEAFDVLGSWKVESAKNLMIQATGDSSYMVAGNALDAVRNIDSTRAYEIARSMFDSHPKSNLLAVIYYIIGLRGAAEDIILYEKDANFEQGAKKFTFMISLTNYLKHVKSDASFNRGIELATQTVLLENMKSYKFAFASFLCDAASEFKETKDEPNSALVLTNTHRRSLIKNAMEKIISTEKDEKTLEKYRTMMKETFE